MPGTGRNRTAVVVALLLSLAACERRPDAAPVDTAAAPPPPAIDTVADTAPSSGWRAEAGPVLLVPDDAPAAAMVIVPTASFDPGVLADAELTLVARHGVAGRAVAGRFSPGSSGACEATVQLRAAGGAPPGAWLVGFASPAIAAVALDSIEALAGPDSARLVADVVRLASTIPDSAEVFRGLPFSVRSVRRFSAAPGTGTLVAEVVRRISTEANPREERTLLIAERAPAAGRHSLAYYERSAGSEESVVAPDVLAVVRIGTPPVLAMVISRDDGEGVRYALIERAEPARWAVRWVSESPGC